MPAARTPPPPAPHPPTFAARASADATHKLKLDKLSSVSLVVDSRSKPSDEGGEEVHELQLTFGEE